jgi:taurine dioxygenase
MDTVQGARLKVRNSGKPVGAEVLGIDLSRDLDDATFAAIKQLFDSNGMIYFRGQII